MEIVASKKKKTELGKDSPELAMGAACALPRTSKMITDDLSKPLHEELIEASAYDNIEELKYRFSKSEESVGSTRLGGAAANKMRFWCMDPMGHNIHRRFSGPLFFKKIGLITAGQADDIIDSDLWTSLISEPAHELSIYDPIRRMSGPLPSPPPARFLRRRVKMC